MVRCTVPGCLRILRSSGGLTQHLRKVHPGLDQSIATSPPVDDIPDSSDELSEGTFRTPLHKQRHRAEMQLPRLSAL